VSNNPLSSIPFLKDRKMRLRSAYVAVLMVATVVFPTAKVVSADASVPVTTTTVATPTTTTTLVPLSKMVEWGRVAHCETGGNWKHEGRMYEGGLGILAWNWKQYGGTTYAPHAWQATPEQQVAIAMKIQHGLPTPDQNGTCGAW